MHDLPCWSELVYAGLCESLVFHTFQLFKKHVFDIGMSGIRCSLEVLFSSTAGSSFGASKEQIVCMVKVTEDGCEE